jgi:hypothetical protein
MASTTVISASHRSSHRDWVSEGWWTSLLVHGLVLYGALLFSKQIHLRPSEPFHWEISLVSSTEGESREASLQDKGAAHFDPSVEAPPVVTSASRYVDATGLQDHEQSVRDSVTAANILHERTVTSTAAKLYEVIAPTARLVSPTFHQIRGPGKNSSAPDFFRRSIRRQRSRPTRTDFLLGHPRFPPKAIPPGSGRRSCADWSKNRTLPATRSALWRQELSSGCLSMRMVT